LSVPISRNWQTGPSRAGTGPAGRFFDYIHQQDKVGIKGALDIAAHPADAPGLLVFTDGTDIAADGRDGVVDIAAANGPEGRNHTRKKPEQGTLAGGFHGTRALGGTLDANRTDGIADDGFQLDQRALHESSSRATRIGFELLRTARGSPPDPVSKLLNFNSF
jgi:hypothetical protein